MMSRSPLYDGLNRNYTVQACVIHFCLITPDNTQLVTRSQHSPLCAALHCTVTQAGSSLKMGRLGLGCTLVSTYRGVPSVHSSLASIRPPWHHPPVSGDIGPSQQWRSVKHFFEISCPHAFYVLGNSLSEILLRSDDSVMHMMTCSDMQWPGNPS